MIRQIAKNKKSTFIALLEGYIMIIGISQQDITPPFSLPMQGFAARVDHFDSVHDRLELTALYCEHDGNGAWIVSADLCKFPDRNIKEKGMAFLTQRLGCDQSALFLNASHTHGGPLMNDYYDIPSPGNKVHRSPANIELTRRYADFLWEKVAHACEEARRNAASATISIAQGTTTFPMNRRALVNGRIENAPNPGGSYDDRLRLLSIKADDTIVALGLILACHPTSTSAQHQITADYVYGWRRQMRRYVDDDTALFFLQACGGDVRPAFTEAGTKWRKARLDELVIMGEQLARESVAAINNGWHELDQPLVKHSQTTVNLPCKKLHEDDYLQLKQSSLSWAHSYADYALQQLDSGKLLSEVPLELTALALDQELILLGGDCEFLHGIGRKIESTFPVRHPIAFGYTNGNLGYVPDKEELARGGYEAESYFWENWSGPFLPEMEEVILHGARQCYEHLK